jgi:hypothetical protein
VKKNSRGKLYDVPRGRSETRRCCVRAVCVPKTQFGLVERRIG